MSGEQPGHRLECVIRKIYPSISSSPRKCLVNVWEKGMCCFIGAQISQNQFPCFCLLRSHVLFGFYFKEDIINYIS